MAVTGPRNRSGVMPLPSSQAPTSAKGARVWSVCGRSASMVVMSVPLAGEPRAAVSDRPARPRSPRRPRRARIAALFVGVVVGLFGLFAFPAGAAQAHAELIRTSPAQGSIVTSAPSEIVVTFSEAVQPVTTRITVIAPDGKRIDSGNPRVQGDNMHIPVRTNVPGGTYLVSYRVISADSHPVGGGFTYSVGAPSPGGAPKPLNGGETDKVVATSVSVMQFVGFVGLILVLGPAMVLIALWPRRLDRRQPIRIVYGGLGLIAVATIAGLYLQAPYDSGGSLTSVTGADLSDVFDSHFGQANLVRLALVVIIGFLLRPVLAGKGTKTEHILLAVLGTVGVGTWALAGHPGASDVAPLTRSPTSRTWRAWPSGSAAWSCWRRSCCAGRMSANSTRSCRCGRTGRCLPSRCWCSPAPRRR